MLKCFLTVEHLLSRGISRGHLTPCVASPCFRTPYSFVPSGLSSNLEEYLGAAAYAYDSSICRATPRLRQREKRKVFWLQLYGGQLYTRRSGKDKEVFGIRVENVLNWRRLRL